MIFLARHYISDEKGDKEQERAQETRRRNLKKNKKALKEAEEGEEGKADFIEEHCKAGRIERETDHLFATVSF